MFTASEVIRLGPLFILLITTLAGVRIYFINAPLALKLLFQLCLVLLAVDSIGIYVRDVLQDDNKWLYNLYFICCFLYLAYIYMQVIEHEGVRVSIQIFFGVFIVFALLNSLFLQGLHAVQSFTFVFGGIFTIYLAVAYFWQLLVSPENDKIMLDPIFWMSFGLIVYYGGNVPFYGMFNYLEKNFYDFTVFYLLYISNGFATFLYIMFLMAFICRKSYPKLY
jgi:hypothetical protein